MDYVWDATLATLALFGVLSGACVVLCIIGILFSKKENDDEM